MAPSFVCKQQHLRIFAQYVGRKSFAAILATIHLANIMPDESLRATPDYDCRRVVTSTNLP